MKEKRLIPAGLHGCIPKPETNKSNIIYLINKWTLKQNFRG